jgi:hypothetical protein
MKEQEWTFERPASLPDGPWKAEPDKAQWMSPTGLPCMVRRGGLSAWCGYVGIPKSHPLFEKDYSDIEAEIDVHGGLTFASKCSGGEHGICHVVEEGEDDDVWWLGFDCGHFDDLLPEWTMNAGFLPIYGDPSNPPSATYKTYDWVRAETERLAAQLAQLQADVAKLKEGK